jgi:hypothetical protein
LIVQDNDTLAMVDQALDVYNCALEPKRLVTTMSLVRVFRRFGNERVSG